MSRDSNRFKLDPTIVALNSQTAGQNYGQVISQAFKDLGDIENNKINLQLADTKNQYEEIKLNSIKDELDDDKTVIGYKNSILSTEAKQLIKEKILYYFDKEKAYLNPNLNMDLLSESINFPKYQITEVLNVEIGKNFFQFVNSYRIEAVKKMLLEPKLKYSIEAIGYECGFNSKSSFYTVFKNLTGETPVAFRKKALDTED